MVTPMRFEYRRPPGFGNTDGNCFIVEFPDGREGMFIVSAVETYDGTLVMRDHRGEVGVAFAPGTWVCVYAASAMSGDPMVADWVKGPKTDGKS